MSVGPERAWERRKDLVRATQRRIEQRYVQFFDMCTTFQWATKMVANVIVATLWLTLYRPLVQEPIVVPPDDRPNVLVLSVELLEKHSRLHENPASRQIKWLASNYVQWHPLAITLAELCVQTEGPLVERAWRIVNHYYYSVARKIADSSRGMRWQPIRKLMSKAKKAKQAALQQYQDPTAQMTPTGAFDFNQLGPLPVSSSAAAPVSNFQICPTSALTQGMGEMPELSTVGLPQDTFDWDPWWVASTNTSMPYPAVTAWAQWVNFLDDFQGESYMQGLDFGQSQSFGGP